MDYIKISAKTVSDAVLEAAIKLETSSDNLEYEVMDPGTTGFLGFGAKPAVIRARVREADEELEVVKKEDIISTPEVEVEETPIDKFMRTDKEPIVNKAPKVPVNKEEAESAAIKFLEDVFKSMNMEVQVTADYDGENLNVDIAGPDMGILIGKRGQTLDSLQYLTSLVVNKGKASYVRVKLDTENYRDRRKETLENLAKNIAYRVKKTRKPVVLEPMNPYERRIIHSVLQNNPSITTHSEGEEPFRKVVVTLKK